MNDDRTLFLKFFSRGKSSVFYDKKTPVFRWVFLIFTVSCLPGKGNLSGNVLVIPMPYGRGDVVQSRRPRVTYSPQPEGRDVPCRRESPNLRSIRDTTGLDVIADLLLEDEIEAEEGGDPQERISRREPVNVTVTGAWMKFGLLIDNKNTGVGRNHTLVVEQLEYFVDGQCERDGQPPCKIIGAIEPGYCGLPFLYLVPSGKKVEYKPLSNDPLHNLTIYLSNLPVIDRTQQSLEGKDTSLPGGAFFILPQYKVTLVLTGSFLLEDGTVFEFFLKRIRFQTSARQAH